MKFKLTWSADSMGFEEYESVEEFDSLAAAEASAHERACEEFIDEYIGCVDGCPTREEYLEDEEGTEDEWCELVDGIMEESAYSKVEEL
jgi:hypothetical protein